MIFIIAILVIIGCIAGIYNFQLSPVAKDNKQVVFAVNQGEARDQVLANLKKEGLIRNETVAKIESKISGKQEFVAGNFLLSKNMGTRAILSDLVDIKKAKEPGVAVTFPEGITAEKCAKIIASKTKFNKDDIIAKWNDKEYVQKLQNKYWFLTDDIYKSQKVYLEGYIMPSTYFINEDKSIEDFTEKILDNTEQVLDGLKADMEKSKLSTSQIITLASIVQDEATKKEDMDKVAGVFYNRMAKNMNLGSSITVKYAIGGDLTWQEIETNTHIDSDYNTYKNPGLPPGPVGNPGKEAIDAVLHPEKTDYLYFLADVKNDGKVYYSKTLQEHEKKVRKYLTIE